MACSMNVSGVIFFSLEPKKQRSKKIKKITPDLRLLDNYTFRLFKYQAFVVFSFDIFGNPEQRKLEFFYTTFFVGFLNSLA